jgi:hypothetical protein
MSRSFLMRCAAWLILAAVAVVTLSPIGLRPKSPAPADLERLAAFVVLGLAFVLAYPRRWVATVALLCIAAGLLEIGQHLVPGRHGMPHDIALKAAGAGLGAGLALAMRRAAFATGVRLDSRD